jgi:hypothetical protein
MSFMSRGLSMLRRVLGRAAGGPVAYTRGAVTLDVTAWVGRTVYAQLPGAGTAVAVVYGERDYLFPAAALAGLDPPEPRKGDRIEETIDGEDLTFEVLPGPAGEPAWRYSDPGRTLVRVHCKKVG